MANIKSQIKRIGTNKKAQERNKAVKSELKTAIRAAKEAVASGDAAKANAAIGTATKKLDKAASKGVIHKNQAANRKSAIAKSIAHLDTAAAKPAKSATAKAAPKAAAKPAAKAKASAK